MIYFLYRETVASYSPVGYRRYGQRGCLESGIVVFGNEYRVHVQEVIPMKSRAYQAIAVNRVDVACLLHERDEAVVHVGLDIGKASILGTLRWGIDDFERPWRIRNPLEIGTLVELLSAVGHGRGLIVAMEPTGTYGDALRQA